MPLPIILWTDALIYLLIAAVVGFVIIARGREHLAAPWRRVWQSKSGMAALVVLSVFVAVGLLDSVHFRPRVETRDAGAKPAYLVEVKSLLDVLAQHLRSRTEKTYSAPFATRAFAKETLERPDGAQVRDYPRLQYGGARLEDESRRNRDIFITAVRAAALGFICWWAVAGLAIAVLAHRQHAPFGEMAMSVWRGATLVPWNVVLITGGIVLLLAFPAVFLSADYHILGTDKVGQDVFYLALKSIRTGLVIGTLTTLVMLPFAVLLGIMAGYLRGWVDDVIQYVYTTLNSIPAVLLIAAFILMMQVVIERHSELFPTAAQRADVRLLLLCVILGVTAWTGLARLLRGEALKLRELEFIQAAQAFGVSHTRIITRHILPNVMHIVLIALVMDFSGLVLAEAVLSYVGVGVDPATISFGTMINSARLEMSREPMVWWSLFAAFLFMFLLVLAANLFADAVRDAFDPRIKIGAAAPRMASAGKA